MGWLKKEEQRIVREALLRSAQKGTDPVEEIKPYTDKLKQIALEGDLKDATTLGALKEVFDRVEGRPSQPVRNEDDPTGRVVDAALLGAAKELLARLPKARKEKVVVDVPPEIESK